LSLYFIYFLFLFWIAYYCRADVHEIFQEDGKRAAIEEGAENAGPDNSGPGNDGPNRRGGKCDT